MSLKSKVAKTGLAAAALGLALPFVAAAAPAAASASCWNAGTDGSVASASCSGYGSVALVVHCDAIWPFESWVDTGPLYYVAGGGNPAYSHTYCGGSAWVSVNYY